MKAALTQLTWQHYRLNPDLPSEEKMGCLLVSHFTKSSCSTIYKMNRNFHYFSWHTCLYLATAQREPAETEEALRGTAPRGACCLHPCQPSLCHQLQPLGKTAALSTHLKSYLYPAQLRRGSAFLCSLPWAASGVRAAGSSAGASGKSMGRLPCLAWGDHHSDMRQPSQWHGVPPVLLQRSPGYPSYSTWSLQGAWGSLTVQEAHLAPTTVHFHPASGPWKCNHHLLVFCWFWHKQVRMRKTTQPKAFVQNLFCWWVVVWPICSACSH